MRTLVTGVAGFVGRHLARGFARQPGEELHGADTVTLDAGKPDEELRSELRNYRRLDMADLDALRAFVGDVKPDRIVHLAALSSAGDSIQDPVRTYRANTLGALNVLEAARLESPRAAVLLVGSADVYGTGTPGQRIKEDAPLHPMNPYGLSKAAQDALGELYAATYHLRVVRARTFSHTGPGQRPRFALAGFADQIARIDAGGVAPEIRVGNVEGVRDYGDVRDVVRAYALLLEHGEPGEAYNVCSGQGHILRELLGRLCAIAGLKPTVIQDPERTRARDADYLVGDPTKLQSKTGWTPEIPIARTLEDLYRDTRERVRRETGR